ncbi:39S ribosomal protein L36, mitochondrial-like [Salvelinus namaycush]|uniref:Ribosomal protein n=1 Tax=Salvelinus namaycush TaxID=8040 RepID=A0A8U0TTR6_SALNM|nr:39S ribosomal protein L36, mitochondrial [Salvelinus alpinus]XP_023831112.1 39S ribosomal protein L36, mitochondrial [Salvelinus alpinus]XP_038827973.1 39S ribosomal protein L36, mitochondrial-like [Salvelinus namaycush]
MAPLLLNHLVSSLTRHLTRITLSRTYPITTTTIISRCLSSLTSYPVRVLLTPGRPIQPLAFSPGSSSQGRVALQGQCQHLGCLQPAVGMKTKSALKRRCKDCFFVVRRGRLFVFCKAHPRHKQRQG